MSNRDDRPIQETDSSDPATPEGQWCDTIEAKERRRLRARAQRENVVWFGLGTFGVVGWSVAIPTIVLTLLGVYLDAHYPTPYSFTLMLLFTGIIIGCLNAWYWINRETANMNVDDNDRNTPVAKSDDTTKLAEDE